MDDKEFTRDLFNLYVKQRRQLDESVPRDVKQQYLEKERKYEQQKVRQKEHYHKKKEELGEEYLEVLRVRNRGYIEKRKQKDKDRQATHTSSPPQSPIRRYASSYTDCGSSTPRDDNQYYSDDDLESVFSEPISEPPPPALRVSHFKKNIGF